MSDNLTGMVARTIEITRGIIEKQAAEIERLRKLTSGKIYDQYLNAQAEIERLQAEAALWKDRWESERRDHEATIEQANRQERGEP